MTEIPTLRDKAAELFATGTDASAAAHVASLTESGFRQMIRIHYPDATKRRKALKEATKAAIRHRYFVGGETLAFIAVDYGVTRQRISQICSASDAATQI